MREAFIKVDGQDLSSLEQNCWRVYYGKAWINKLSSGDYQIKFDSQLNDLSLEESGVRPSFFISKSMIDDSPYEKFKKEKMDELIVQKKPKRVFILSDVPSLNHTKKYINFILEGFNPRKAIMIISNQYELIGQKIQEQLDRGITVLDGHGFYSKDKRQVLYVVVNRQQLMPIQRIIHEIDPNAFVIITDVNQVIGEGFTFYFDDSGNKFLH